MSQETPTAHEPDDVECPTCSRDDFASERGMRIHHSSAHGESISGVTVECAWCGDERELHPSKAERSNRHFCEGGECYGRWRSENVTGEDHPRWTGGYGRYYGASWQRQRRKAIERDDGACVLCGRTRDSHRRVYGTDLNVHHKTPFDHYGVERHQKANRLENLVTLCEACHRDVEGIHDAGDAESDSGAAD